MSGARIAEIKAAYADGGTFCSDLGLALDDGVLVGAFLRQADFRALSWV